MIITTVNDYEALSGIICDAARYVPSRCTLQGLSKYEANLHIGQLVWRNSDRSVLITGGQ